MKWIGWEGGREGGEKGLREKRDGEGMEEGKEGGREGEGWRWEREQQKARTPTETKAVGKEVTGNKEEKKHKDS